MSALPKVKITANFERNLDSISCFFNSIELPGQFEALLDQLFETIIPNLQNFPFMGKDFFSEPSDSVEATMLLQKIKARIPENSSIRKILSKDYIILYWVGGQDIVLLAIKHHRQLSFDVR